MPRRALSAGVKDPKAIGLRRISINDLDWRPSPLPNADAWRAGELDLPAGAFDCNARPGFGSARPVRAVRAQHIGEDGDRNPSSPAVPEITISVSPSVAFCSTYIVASSNSVAPATAELAASASPTPSFMHFMTRPPGLLWVLQV